MNNVISSKLMEEAENLSAEWGNTGYIIKSDDGTLTATVWNQFKWLDPKPPVIATVDGNCGWCLEPEYKGVYTFEHSRVQHKSSFLGFLITNSGNSDGYVLKDPEYTATNLYRCHLGNYESAEDAEAAALIQFMIDRPEKFSTLIRRYALYDSRTHLEFSILKDVFKKEGIEMPKNIKGEKYPETGIILNNKPFPKAKNKS